MTDHHPAHAHAHDGADEPSLEEMRTALTASFWDARYGGEGRVWSGRPNRRLVEQVADLSPGSAVDVACGEGADAVWLAVQGWRVSAVDVSEVALAEVARQGEEAGVGERLEVAVYDALADPVPLPGRVFDLVTVSFLHVPEPDFARIYRGIAQAVAPGGRLLVTAHHPHDVTSGVRRPHGPGLLFGPDRVLAALDAEASDSPWTVEVADVQEREQAMAEGPVVVRDTVVRLRREE